jgi:hypothetical protein
MIFLSMVVAWCFERAHMIIAAPNYGATANGFGAIELTVRREIKAPMAYRALVPLLTVGIERLLRLPLSRRVDVYQTLKILLEALAFWAITKAWGLPVAFLSFLLALLTVKYDYWSWAPEMAGLALAMTGDLALALPGVILFALSRETAPLAAVVYILKTGDIAGGLVLAMAAALVLVLVRMWAGRKPLYCSRFQWRYNLNLFFGRTKGGDLILFKWQPIYHSDAMIAAALSFLTIAVGVMGLVGWLVPVILVVAGWTLAKADETRVFAGALPWVAALLLGVG